MKGQFMGKIKFEDVYNLYVMGGRSVNKLILKSDERYISTQSGVYIVRPPKGFRMEFLEKPEGTRNVNGKLLDNQYQDAVKKYTHLKNLGADLSVLYYGRATNLRRRIKQYAKFGYAYKDKNGKSYEEHAGGKLLWYIKNNKMLEIEFYETTNFKAEEERLIREYYELYHELPFANEIFGSKK